MEIQQPIFNTQNNKDLLSSVGNIAQPAKAQNLESTKKTYH